MLCNLVEMSIIAALSLMAQHSLAQTPSGAETASVSGIVLNDATSTPLARATVTVEVEDRNEGLRRAAITGTDGRFSVLNVPVGRYYFTARRPGFMAQPHGAGTASGESLLTVEGAVDNLIFRMTPWAALAGRVTDWNGDPLIAAKVHLIQGRVSGGRFTMATVGKVATNDLGEYRFFSIPPGNYYLSAFYRDSASVLGLRGESGAPGDSTEDYAVTYYPGTAAPGQAEAVRARPGQAIENLDIRLQMSRSATVTGVVVGLTEGTEAAVFLEPSKRGEPGLIQLFTAKGSSGGLFRFESIPPGDYSVWTEVAVGDQRLSARERVAMTGTAIGDLHLRLQLSPAVQGVLVLDRDEDIPDGFELVFTGSDPRMPIRVPVDAGGRFWIPSLKPDDYRIATGNSEFGLVKECRIGGRKLPSATIEVDSSITSLEVLLSTQNGGFEGIVSIPSGDPLSGGLVVAVADQNGDQNALLAVADDRGFFRLGPTLPGDYRIVSYSDVVSAGDLTREALRDTARKGQLVSIDDNEILTVELVAIRSTAN